MKNRMKILSTLAAGVAVVSLAGCGQENNADEAKQNAKPVVNSCGSGDVEKPSELKLGCDGTVVFTGIEWKSWEDSKAFGVGSLAVKTCDPNCANGKTDKQDGVTITLEGKQDNGRYATATYDGQTIRIPSVG